MERKIIFVGGIHGVGKSTFCKVASKTLSINTYSASKLIQSITNTTFAKDKKTHHIDKNQSILIKAIEAFIAPNEHCLLDGHFCLLDKSGKITKIPKSTFSDISPTAILVLTKEPQVIFSQLANRDKTDTSLDVIDNFQKCEIIYAEEISTELDIPILFADPQNDTSKIIEFIASKTKDGST